LPARHRGNALRACFKTPRGSAARDFGRSQGGEERASPKGAVSSEPTMAPGKRPAEEPLVVLKHALIARGADLHCPRSARVPPVGSSESYFWIRLAALRLTPSKRQRSLPNLSQLYFFHSSQSRSVACAILAAALRSQREGWRDRSLMTAATARGLPK
jgi:hypothetical protein